MKCPACDAENEGDSNFCDQCGQTLPRRFEGPVSKEPSSDVLHNPRERIDSYIKSDFVAPQPSAWRRIPAAIRIGFISGAILGLIGSFVWLLMAGGGTHIPAIAVYPLVGPIFGLVFAVLGATVGSLVSLIGKEPASKKARRTMGLVLLSALLLTIIICLGDTGISLADVLSGKFLMYIGLAIMATLAAVILIGQ